jgi:hypothetical protein
MGWSAIKEEEEAFWDACLFGLLFEPEDGSTTETSVNFYQTAPFAGPDDSTLLVYEGI